MWWVPIKPINGAGAMPQQAVIWMTVTAHYPPDNLWMEMETEQHISQSNADSVNNSLYLTFSYITVTFIFR